MFYFKERKFHLSDRLKNIEWLSQLTHLADVFSKLNITCVSLQGKQIFVFQAQDKISRKLQFRPSVSLLEESRKGLPDMIANDMQRHLSSLTELLSSTFQICREKIFTGYRILLRLKNDNRVKNYKL